MPNAEVLKDACNYVAFELKMSQFLTISVLTPGPPTLIELTAHWNHRGRDLHEHESLSVSHRRSQWPQVPYPPTLTIPHVGRLAGDKKAGECDHFACAILEGMLNDEDFQQRALQIEILANGGHAFVVVDRRDETELNEIDNWQDAILVDVWKYNQGVDTEPVWWATESQSLRTYRARI